MTIEVHVSVRDGLKHGVEPGTHAVEVPVASLSVDDRELLARCLQYPNTLHKKIGRAHV